MSTRAKVLTASLITVFLLALIVGVTFIPHTHFDFEAEEISKITIRKGDTGEKIEIEDEDEIKTLVDNINSITYKKGWLNLNDGFTYRIKIYDQNDKVISTLTVRGESSITTNNFEYIAKENEIDYDHIDGLFEEK